MAQIKQPDKKNTVTCKQCPQNLEVSGLITIDNYLLLLPQNHNIIYYYSFDDLNNSSNPTPQLLAFKASKTPAGSQGWEALTYRKIDENSYVLYFVYERWAADTAAVLTTNLTYNPGTKSVFTIDSLRQIGPPLPGDGNLSYEAATWVQNDSLGIDGLLLIPEQSNNPKMQPRLMTKHGNIIPVEADPPLHNFRTSDLTFSGNRGQQIRYYGISFCWKGVNRNFKKSDRWCFNQNDTWNSKLTLYEFELNRDINGILKMQIKHIYKLHSANVDVEGPDKHKKHEYNAEGLALSPAGEFVMVNDNYPDGPHTEIRFYDLKTIF